MISLNQTVKVLRAYLQKDLNDVPAGILAGGDSIPIYKCDGCELPPICKNNPKYKETRSICAKFYELLKISDQEIICPFGINLSVLKLENTPIPISFFIQTEYHPDSVNENNIKLLNRMPKKAVRVALEEMRKYKYNSLYARSRLNLLRQITETVLAGRVAASMRILTHEILTPVQGVMSDLKDLQHKHKDDNHIDDERILRLMQSNVEEINRIAKQVHVLLSEDITPSLQRIRKVVVHKIIKEACDRLESIADNKELKFNNGFNSGILAVDAVPDQLDIVFRCLLDNAAKYSFRGRFDEKRTIDIRYEDVRYNSLQALKVSIQSYGCPITAEEIEKRSIFELGYRGEFSGDRGRQGTGSGLYIVDRIVEAHNGAIEVESKIVGNLGDTHQAVNTFTVYWPKNFYENNTDE